MRDGARAVAPTIGVLAAEQNSLALALLRADWHPRPVWLGDHRVAQVSYDPRDPASSRVAVRARDAAGSAIEFDRSLAVVNLGLPTSTDPELDDIDRPYAAGEWRAAWLAALATAPCQVLNRPSGGTYWLLEAGPVLLRRRLRELGVPTVVDRVIPAAAVDRHARQGWQVGASITSSQTAPVESHPQKPHWHYRVLLLRPPLRYFVRAVLLDHVLPLRLSTDGDRLITETPQVADALAPTSIEVCRLLELDVGFVTFVETESVPQVSLVGMTPPVPLDQSAGAVIAGRLHRELTSRHRR